MKDYRHQLMANPPRYKTFILTWLAIYPLINLVLILFETFLNPLPLFLRTLFLTLLLVFLMTYYVMPWMNRRFFYWLHSTHSEQGRKS